MGTIVKHLAIIGGISALIVLCIAYPFLPGGHDQLAVPLSTMAQVSGVLGLLLVPVGLWWLAMPRHGFVAAVVSVAAGTFVANILALFATLSVGNVLGMLALAVWLYILVLLLPRLKRARRADGDPFNPVPVSTGAPACDRAHLAAGPCRSCHQIEQESGDRERERVDQ